MSRRRRPDKREIFPDVRYNSVEIQSFINRVMHDGKKTVAAHQIYAAMDIIQERTNREPMDVFDQAMKNVSPVMEVKPRRVGGATYQVPMEVPSYRRFALAVRWLLAASRGRSGKSFAEKLAAELMDAANNTGNAIRKREETHKMAEANRAFSHYRV